MPTSDLGYLVAIKGCSVARMDGETQRREIVVPNYIGWLSSDLVQWVSN